MTSRVQQLEQVLEKLKSRDHDGRSVVGQENAPSTSDPASIGTSTKTGSVRTADREEVNDLDRSAARLLVKGGKSKYIRNNFWATINDDVRSYISSYGLSISD